MDHLWAHSALKRKINQREKCVNKNRIPENNLEKFLKIQFNGVLEKHYNTECFENYLYKRDTWNKMMINNI